MDAYVHNLLWWPPFVGITFAVGAFLAILLSSGPNPIVSGRLSLWTMGVTLLIVACYGEEIAQHHTPVLLLILIGVVVSSLIAAARIDIVCGRIDPIFPAPALLASATVAAMDHRILTALLSVFVVSVPFAIAAIATRGRAFGIGDLEVIICGAFLLNLELSIVVFAVCFVVSPLIAILRGKRKDRLILSPYLCAGICFAVLIPIGLQS